MTAPILIVAPCPLGRGAVEGWMSRIRTIDSIFAGQSRIYLDFVSGGATGGAPSVITHDEVIEYRLDMLDPRHRELVEELVNRCRFVYVHTVHLSRFVLPFYMTGKIITDMHGIVPDEERMLGRPTHADFYEAVEATVIMASRIIVVVTEAMRDHLLQKYPECQAEFLVAPIIEAYEVDFTARLPRAAGDPYRVVYSGGTQPWQNVDDTIATCESVGDICTFEFLSHEHDIIRQRASENIRSCATFRVVDKDQLANVYLNKDLGFVLRDPISVNRVSCPTKLSEYLWFGVIPIVKSAMIGDFASMGYCYLTMQEFATGLLPDEETLRRMREINYAIVNDLSKRFSSVAAMLSSLELPNRIAGSGTAGLPVGERYLVFPSQAEVYLFGDQMCYQTRQCATQYDNLDMSFDPPRSTKSVRIVPLLADMRVAIESIAISVEGDSGEPQVSAHSPGKSWSSRDGTAVFSLTKELPYIDLHFDRTIDVSRVACRVHFESFGKETASATVTSPPPSLRVEFLVRGSSVKCAIPLTGPA